MVTALYRRYRPENFAEMIGQSQVTDPLMTALRTNRVNHAYLFSGPRGCGKTTSARILARCLNCAEGPTDKPCGVCPSCVELSRDGMGSLDVVEIDAASHGGVDDARDLRERAIFAPARDRYKIFIIDEAHMVTSGGFNALLKIVEEPPEHIKFIFATTEPDKVIGTIRSRTHHYPFRLIPPAQLLEYVQQLCETEGVEVAPGVLPLVVRAGGGSARDTLSLLDQLIAGSENNRVEYERAVALLGYTHGALLSEVIDAIGAHDGAAAFDAVDRVIQTGQDPRRFVEDLLERLRDVIIVAATRESAASVLRGVPAEEIEGMRRQAALFGHAELSRVADIVNDALTEMTGATSPRLHLELMIARTLVPAADDTQRGALARVERLERRIGVDGPDAPRAVFAPGAAAADGSGSSAPLAGSAGASGATGAGASAASGPASAATSSVSAGAGRSGGSGVSPSAAGGLATEGETQGAAPGSGPVRWADTAAPATDPSPAAAPAPATASPGAAAPGTAVPRGSDDSGPDVAAVPQSAVPAATSTEAAASASPINPARVSLQQLKDAWPEILESLQKTKMTAWLVVYTAQVRAFDDDVLTLAFPSENDVANFKERSAPGEGVSEHLRQAILAVLGVRVMYRAHVDTTLRPASDSPVAQSDPSDAVGPHVRASAPAPAPSSEPTPVVATPSVAPASSAEVTAPAASGATPSAEVTAPTPASAAPSAAPTTSAAPTSSAEVAAPTPASATSSTAPTAASSASPSAPATGDAVRDAAVPDRGDGAPAGVGDGAPAADADIDDDDEDFDDDDFEELPPAEDLPPEPVAVVDAAGWTVPGLNENTAASTEPATESDSAEVARMRAQLAALTNPGTAAGAASAPTKRPQSDSRPQGAAPSAPPQASQPERQQGSAPAERPERSANTQRPQAGQRPAPTTSWDVVAIPTSSEPDDHEVPFADEPMPSDEPDLPADRAHGLPGDTTFDAPRTAGGRTDSTSPAGAPPAAAQKGGGSPASERRPGALRFEAVGDDPAAPSDARRTAPPSAPANASAGGRARYGEAVVREILGANFIEEQPLPGRDG